MAALVMSLAIPAGQPAQRINPNSKYAKERLHRLARIKKIYY